MKITRILGIIPFEVLQSFAMVKKYILYIYKQEKAAFKPEFTGFGILR